MNKTWKWILGILLVVAIVAVIGVLSIRQNGGVLFTESREAQAQAGDVPGIRPDGAFGEHKGGPGVPGPMMEGGAGEFRGPRHGQHGLMMMGHGSSPFGGLIQLVQLIVVALLVYGAYVLGRGAGMAAASAPAKK
ncbi:MAG TPA: hypothetical protein VGJ22_13840 [Anaerolineales bacterium]|jgi:hypothetical protein